MSLSEIDVEDLLVQCAAQSTDRLSLWSDFIETLGIRTCAEVGVYRGLFAESLLRRCDEIERYYMLDPWRHLTDWNKPANRLNSEFASIRCEALERTDFASGRRVVLQGKTTEVSDQIPHQSLDFAYIDADHTLRGITIDLIRMLPKMKVGGVIAGDDFQASIWQHERQYEPTLVFPFAIHFAEAHQLTIFGLPHNQFAILVRSGNASGFRFHDLTGEYSDVTLARAMNGRRHAPEPGRAALRVRLHPVQGHPRSVRHPAPARRVHGRNRLLPGRPRLGLHR